LLLPSQPTPQPDHQKLNINSLPVCGQFKTTTTKTKTDQVSIKPKYIQITNKNETLTHPLYLDNSKHRQQKQNNNNKNSSSKYQTKILFKLQTKTKH